MKPRLLNLAAGVSLLLGVATVVLLAAWVVAMGWATATGQPEYGYGTGPTRYFVGATVRQFYVVRVIRFPQGPPPPGQTGVVSMSRDLKAGSMYPVEWSHDFREAYFSANAADTYDVKRPQILPHWQRVIEMDRKWVAVKLWPCVLILGLLPAIAGTRAVRRAYHRRRAFRLGLCPTCRYDLRASPDRCPECGAVPASGAV